MRRENVFGLFDCVFDFASHKERRECGIAAVILGVAKVEPKLVEIYAGRVKCSDGTGSKRLVEGARR